MNCQEVREDAATTLLTGDELEQPIAEHLVTCDECRREIDELRPVVSLLRLAPPPSTSERPDDRLLRRMLVQAAGERRRRRRVGVAVAVAAAALVIGVPALSWVVSADNSRPEVVGVASLSAQAADPQTGVHGTAHLQPSPSGSDLTVSVHGVTPGTRCRLVVVDGDGRRSVVDTWTASYRGKATVTTTTELPMSQVSHVELVNAVDAGVLLRLEFA